MSEFWELVSFCAVDLPPGLLMDVYVVRFIVGSALCFMLFLTLLWPNRYGNIIDRSVGNCTMPGHVIESFRFFLILYIAVHVCSKVSPDAGHVQRTQHTVCTGSNMPGIQGGG
jgi:hypothetical protein